MLSSWVHLNYIFRMQQINVKLIFKTHMQQTFFRAFEIFEII